MEKNIFIAEGWRIKKERLKYEVLLRVRSLFDRAEIETGIQKMKVLEEVETVLEKLQKEGVFGSEVSELQVKCNRLQMAQQKKE
ncbi:hypothetical protein KAI58_03455 [Candidatus Gracilibacteria bacterium]|nr:hypothetical protein [Candidatus Gracilibacteria bacterium]